MIVYIYTFPNGKKYIGQTMQTLQKRANNGKGYKTSPAVNQAIEKYGWENIHIETFECKSELEMDALERALIEKYQTTNRDFGYNIEDGGNKNKHLSEETKKKMSEARKGEKCYWYGKHHTEESKQKMAENQPFARKVICVETKEIFPTISAAGRSIDRDRTNIAKACNSHGKSGGLHWRWLEEYEKEFLQ